MHNVILEFAHYSLDRLMSMQSIRHGQREVLSIAPVPHNEVCIQASNDSEVIRFGSLECEVFARQLLRLYGEPPVGAELIIVENIHEAGVYHDVNVLYKPDEDNSDAEDWALLVENGCSDWDEKARLELVEAEHPFYVGKVVKMRRA